MCQKMFDLLCTKIGLSSKFRSEERQTKARVLAKVGETANLFSRAAAWIERAREVGRLRIGSSEHELSFCG